MAPEGEKEKEKKVGLSQEEYDIVKNKIAMAIAKREELVRGWMAKSARAAAPRKTHEELLAEDRKLFGPQPSNSDPKESLTKNTPKDLRTKFFPTKGLKASKARDAEEKAASTKRASRDQSSDEEEGRSSLGRAKRQRTKSAAQENTKITASVDAKRNVEDTKMTFDSEAVVMEEYDDMKQFADSKLIPNQFEPAAKVQSDKADKDGSGPTKSKKKKKKKKVSGTLQPGGGEEPALPTRYPSNSIASPTMPNDEADWPSGLEADNTVARLTITSSKKSVGGAGIKSHGQNNEERDKRSNSSKDEVDEEEKTNLEKELKKQMKKERKEQRRREKLKASGLS